MRYELRVNTGIDNETGARQQVKRRYATEREAKAALARISDEAMQGTFVARKRLTVEQVCAAYVAGRHRLRATSRAKLEYDIAPLRERHGAMPVQRLTKQHIDELVADLLAGGTKTAKGRTRRKWSAVAVNKTVQTIAMILADAARQGIVVRNAAEYVDRVEVGHKVLDTYTETEVSALLAALADDRLGHAWELALMGLRRGEIAGLRWSDIDLDAKTLSVANNRVSAGGKTTEGAPKSATSRRTLPLPDRLVSVLRAAQKRQKVERLALGGDYGSGTYVVSNEVGEPYNPAVLSRYWAEAVKAAGLRHIRLHDARHTAATAMHLRGVPVAVIAAWIGHKDASLTLRLYAHSQADALAAAGATFERVVSTSVNESR
ncbi:tyrosine-type recombinase/integrase [Mycolicibacterium sp. Dal123E01]|uniref:tyrosine-type recombinase/integrase n=1 Tax=Mycolicibacterium sp. Dal123E01 TaxID=3457578 RepID=UPI00403EBC8D